MKHVRAVIMAGGKSERMRATAGPSHKALALVRGVRLLEWNVRTLLFYGIRDIVVAISPKEPEIAEFIARANEVASAAGATLTSYVENVPLGNIGAAREVIGSAQTLLVLYVDNLAAIDLRSLVAFHEADDYAMTIATHIENFVVPYGKLTVRNNEVVCYREKPSYRVRVSSGTCALSRRGCEAIPAGVPIGASELFTALRNAGERVGAFQHTAPWVDINDAASLTRAHRVVEEHWPVFEELRGT